MPGAAYPTHVNAVDCYRGLADPLRIRMLNLLGEGPLCVCHLVEILGGGQVRMSKQLRYLKRLGLVESERRAQWMIYRLSEPVAELVGVNLRCLRKGFAKGLPLARDLVRRTALLERLRTQPSGCSAAVLAGRRVRSRGGC